MFDPDLDALDTTALLAAAAEYAQDQEHAAVGVLRTALAFADRNATVEWVDGGPLPGYERLQVYGGEGCPGVSEFAPIELGAVLGMSSGAASSFLGEALALRHRLPRVWAAVLNGTATSWKARSIARACLSLSLEAAAIVDRRVAGIVNTITPGALKKIVTAAMWQADPDKAQAAAEAAANERGVFVAQSGPSDDYGTKRIWVRAATGDVVRFDATINQLARALKTLGDTDPLNQRRAKAIGWIADPEAAHNLLEVARYLARHQPAQPAQPTTVEPPKSAHPAVAEDEPIASDDVATADQARCEEEPMWDDVATCEDDARSGDEPVTHDEAVVHHAGVAYDEPVAYGDGCAYGDPMADDGGVAYDEPVAYSDDAACGDGVEDEAIGGDTDGSADIDCAGGIDGVGELDELRDDEAFTRLALADTLKARLAAIKQDAYSNGLGAGSGLRGRHTLYVHLTDKTLATATGVLRVEELGPLLATQLTELLGHDQVVVKPVIDLHDQVSVHSYEIPDRIRERVRLRHPVDMFPYSGAEATISMDQDHITPYDHAQSTPAATTYEAEPHDAQSLAATGDQTDGNEPSNSTGPSTSVGPSDCIGLADRRGAAGPTRPPGRTTPPDRSGPPGKAGQTGVDNLIPQGRLHHRAKTFGGWRNRRLPNGAIEWTSPHGFRFHVDHYGTHPQPHTKSDSHRPQPRPES